MTACLLSHSWFWWLLAFGVMGAGGVLLIGLGYCIGADRAEVCRPPHRHPIDGDSGDELVEPGRRPWPRRRVR